MELPQKLQRKSNNNLLWVLLIGFAIACSLAYLFKAKDQHKAAKIEYKATQKKIERVQKMHDSDITAEVLKAKQYAVKAKILTKSTTYEKDVTTNVGNDSITSYLANYKFNRYLQRSD